MLVGVGSVKGSPGATTLALGLASVWPGTSVLLVEADPSGGDVGLWREVGSDPGLVSLAGAARHGRPDTVDVLEHAHELGTGLWVVPGPAGADQARAAVHLVADRAGLLPAVEERFDAVVVDLGRLDPASPARGLLPVLDVLLLTGRGTVADLTHLAATAPDLAQAAAPVRTAVVLTQGCRYATGEVQDALGVPLLAVLPQDRATAAMLAGATERTGRVSVKGRGRAGGLSAALGDLARTLEPMARPRLELDDRAPVAAPPHPTPSPRTVPGDGRSPAERRAVANRAPSPASWIPDSDPEPTPSHPIPLTAEQAGWTRATPTEPPGGTHLARRRTS